MLTRILFSTSVLIVLLTGCIFHFPGRGRLQLIAETDLVTADEQKRITKLLTQRLEGLGIDADDIEIHHIQQGMSVTILQYSDYDDIELKRIRYAVESGEHFALWETYMHSEVADLLVKADIALYDSLNSSNAPEKQVQHVQEEAADRAIAMEGNADPFSVRAGATESPILKYVKIYTDNSGNPAEDAIIGIVDESDTATVMHFLQLPVCKSFFPPALKFAWGRNHYIPESGEQEYYLIALKKNHAGTARLPDPVIAGARKNNKSFSDPLSISVRFDKPDAEKWAAMTLQNTGRDIAFAIDDYVISTLRVTNEIRDGGQYIIGKIHHYPLANDLQQIIDGGSSGCDIKVVSVENYPR